MKSLSHSGAAGRLRLRVSAAAERRLRSGHPWLFADSIQEQNREGALGELGVVYDRQDRFLAVGLFDPESPIRLRVLQARKPALIERSWWISRLAQALEKRRGLFDEFTTGFRWLNGESDGWPGLVLDRYADTLVLKLYTALWLPRWQEIIEMLSAALRPERVVLRLSRNVQATARQRFGLCDGRVVPGQPLEGPVVFLESGLRFEADVVRGQKTGFFLDQRENRREIETLARGRRVLNAFSFSGAFSVYAARGGAAHVTDLDLSAHALASARRNFGLNRSVPAVAGCRHELVQAEALAWLAANPRKQFDLVILDPPSFAKRESERAGAIRAYTRLAALALPHLAPAGILLACSCSAHVSADEFFAAIRRAAAQSGRSFEQITTTGHAPDHPSSFPEAQYLKAIYLRAAPGSRRS